MSEAAIEFDDEPIETPESTEVEEPTEEPTEETPEAPEPVEEDSPPEPLTEAQQEIFNRAIGKKVAQLREAERAAEEYRARLDELEQTRQVDPAGDTEPQPPQDMWADDYDQRQQQFLKDHAAWAKREAMREFETQQQEEYARYQQEQEAADQYQKALAYTEKAKSLGIKEADLQVAGNAVAQVGIEPSLVQYILEDDQGPGLTMYLAKNITELNTLSNKSPLQAAVYLETVIKPRVVNNLRRANPPPPAEGVKGSAMPMKERGPKGAVFE